MGDANRLTPPLSSTRSDPPLPPSYETLEPTDLAVSVDDRQQPYPSPLASGRLHLHHSVDSISPARTPSRQRGEEIPVVEVENLPDTSPPPPYSPRRWSVVFSRASNSLQRNVVNHALPPEESVTLYERMQTLHQQSSNSITFLWNFGQILLSTVGCLLVLIGFLIVPLAILVVGIVYFNSCQAQPLIPIFLIVGGLILILKVVLLVIEGLAWRNSSYFTSRLKPVSQLMMVCCWRSGSALFNLILVAWIATAGYWTFSEYNEVVRFGYFNCNETLYKFSFSVLTLGAATFVIWLFCLCMACCCASVTLHKRKPLQHSSGEGMCNSDWIINGGGPSAAVVPNTQEIRIQEVGTEEDGGSEVSYREMQDNSSDDGSAAGSGSVRGSVTRQVPVEITLSSSEGGLVSVDEEDEDCMSVGSSTLSPGLHLNSQELDTASSRLGSMSSSQRASNGHRFPEMGRFATGLTPPSFKTQSLQRQPKSQLGTFNQLGRGGAQQSQSSFGNLESVAYLPFKRHSSEQNAAALRNTTSSYVNLAPIPSVRQALTLSECVRSNPQLHKSPHRTWQPQKKKVHEREAKTRSMETHSRGRRLRYPSMDHSQNQSRTSLREQSLDGSSLYITVQSEGYSTTFV